MQRFFKQNSYVLLLFSFVFFIASCNNDTGKKTDEKVTTDTVKAMKAAQPEKANLTGTLDNLYMDADTFKKLKKGIVLAFTFRSTDKLTLFGWDCKNNNCTDMFSDYPTIKLQNGSASSTKYGPDVIFQNVRITKKGVEDIQKLIGSYLYVVFVPENDGESIKYKIHVTSDDPNKPFPIRALLDTGIEANPSPPKNYN